MSRNKKHLSGAVSLRDHIFDSIIKRALRHHPLLEAGGPGFVVLVAAPGYATDEYSSSVRNQLYGDDQFFRREDIGFLSISGQEKPSRIAEEFETSIYLKSRVIILAEYGAELHSLIQLSADCIIQIPPITPDVFKASCRATLRVHVSDEEAKEALSYQREYLWAALANRRPVGEALRRLKMIALPLEPVGLSVGGRKCSDDIPALSDMHGYGPAKDWGIQLSKDLKEWRQGTLDWNDVDRGIVLSGPPGVGKTIFAKALAKECNVRLVATSLGNWQSRGHLGDLLKAMRKDFARARDDAPSILFIDEIDAFGARDKFKHDHAEYSIQVVNALLECLDGIDGREGVVVVGATNNISRIDPAVLRSGRLDRHIEIPLPSFEDRVAILRQITGQSFAMNDLEELGSLTTGMTGADLAKSVREAKRIARSQKRSLTLDDLKSALPEVIQISSEHKHSIAIHEAGHTVVGLRLQHGRFLGTTIIDRVVVGVAVQEGGAAYFEHPNIARRDRGYFLDQIAVLLAGIAAEQLCLGSIGDGAGISESSDLAQATRLATLMETSLGMGSSLIHNRATDGEGLELLRMADPRILKSVDTILSEQFERATTILHADRAWLDLVAKELEAGHVFTREMAEELLTVFFRREGKRETPPLHSDMGASRRRSGKGKSRSMNLKVAMGQG